MTIKEFFESSDLAIHCDTEEKAIKLLEAFDKAGYCWVSGNSYAKNTNWGIYKEKTCYDSDRGYRDIEYFKEYDFTIIGFDEIEFEDASFTARAEKVQFVPDKEEKEEKGPQSMKEEKKAIEETLKKCASFFGITKSICTYTYEYSDNKITLYTDKPGLWIGYHGNSSTILRAALSTALHRDNVEVAFVELRGIMTGSIKIGE